MSTLYRKTNGHGWLHDDGKDNDRKWFDLGWRRATLWERVWYAIFYPRQSFAEYMGLVLVILVVHDMDVSLLDSVLWIIGLTFVALVVVTFLKYTTEPPRLRAFLVGVWDGFREVLHRRGWHRLCREVEARVYDRTEYGPEMVVGIDDNGKPHKVDVTTFGGRRVYRTEKRHG